MKNPEALGEEIDRLDSVTTMLVNGRGLPDKIHVEALRATLPAVVKALKAVYEAETGENPWE